MAKWGSSGSLRLRDTGEPANAMAMVGSAFDIVLVYLDADGNPASLDGWRLSATGAFHKAEWSDGDDLVGIAGARLTAPQTLPVAPFPDQSDNPGAFTLAVEADAVPRHLRDVPANADVVPTLICWVVFAGPNGTVDQARVAVGFRGGAGSM